jgi:phosphatidylinositol phospholipase C beta
MSSLSALYVFVLPEYYLAFAEELAFEQLTALTFAEDKTFAKLLKKQAKEMDTLQKRLAKDKAALLKTQLASYEKLAKALKKY